MTSRLALLMVASIAAITVTTLAVAEPRPGGDRLRVEDPEQRSVAVPTRGMTMDNVRDVYGEPRDVRGPVGDPPITRWDYRDFSVYFEHHLVLHSVIRDDDR
ncbi:hypothetical protein [Natronospira bacteriovora]|uniref:Phosphodiesterase n=1 Tax=Natronospira bacteriovora TaxID=3069753 RepID=A0ABU0W2L9_9GAMM|nr:hypothetical protein [Natronospira sp. AB-CW4]MDQ2068266.1 hypothetical protein [Natronospira sp. AB-CW4]